MVEAIEHFFLETVGRELSVVFCSMLPIIECRGAVPFGALLGLPWWQTMLFAVAGNLLPVPFLLLFMRKILEWMGKSRVKFLTRISGWLERKVEKNKGKIEKYSYFGVFLFVAVPLPGTGAWTGSLIASVLKLDPKKSFAAATGGVIAATVVMLILSYSIRAIVT